MIIKAYPNGIYGATTYLVYDENSLEGAIVDCTSSVNEIAKEVKEKNINIKYILITHGHFDHVYCVSDMKAKFPQALILIHKEDLVLLNQVETQCAMAGIESIQAPCVDGLLDENSKNLVLGGVEIKIIHTKGHSKGGICYLVGDNLFSGDTLFRESIGRCDLYGGSFEEIKESIEQKLFTLNENIIVYPGHGESTTIAFEKRFNPYFGSEKNNCF